MSVGDSDVDVCLSDKTQHAFGAAEARKYKKARIRNWLKIYLSH